MKRYFLIVVALFLMIIVQNCFAAELSFIYVWDASQTWKTGDPIPTASVRWYRYQREYYLFLPSGFDASKLFMHLTGGATSVTINGEKINNDSVTDAFKPGEKLTVSYKDQTYTLNILQSSNIGAVFFRTKSGNLDYLQTKKKNTETGSWVVLDKDGMISYSNSFEQIRGRGNSSYNWKKTPFQVKLLEKSPILDMDTAKVWLLIPSYRDNSMIRNAITLDMGKAANMKYTPDYRFVDVYANRIYYGTYMLTEKVQQGKKRVNIVDLQEETQKVNKKRVSFYDHLGTFEYRTNTIKYYDIPINPEDITGGYLLTLQLSYRYTDSGSGFVTKGGQAVLLKTPEYASRAQVRYISSLVQSFENAIMADDGIDPESGKHFFEIADKDSLVGKYLIEEISKNLDSNRTSYYLYKYNDYISEKLFWGPIWDYDNAYGLFSSGEQDPLYATLADPCGLFAAQKDATNTCWFSWLYKHEEFVEAVKEAYVTQYRPLIEVLLSYRLPEQNNQLRSLDAYRDFLTEAASMNFLRWPTFNDPEFPGQTGEDFIANIEYIRNFLTMRMEYLDSIWITE